MASLVPTEITRKFNSKHKVTIVTLSGSFKNDLEPLNNRVIDEQ